MGCCFSASPLEELMEQQPLLTSTNPSDPKFEGTLLLEIACDRYEEWDCSVCCCFPCLQSNQKFEHLGDIYNDAGIAFQRSMCCKEAGESFALAGHISFLLSEQNSTSKLKRDILLDQANQRFNAAFSCYKKCADCEGAIFAMEKVITICINNGNMLSAAKKTQALAQYLESEGLIHRSIEYYEDAADYYETVDCNNAHSCLKHAGDLYAITGNYCKGIELFEKAGELCIQHHLLKYTARLYFFHSLLVTLLGYPDELEKSANRLKKYNSEYKICRNDRDFLFFEEILKAFQNQNVEHFQDAVGRYEELKASDKWTITILLRIKTALNKSLNSVL